MASFYKKILKKGTNSRYGYHLALDTRFAEVFSGDCKDYINWSSNFFSWDYCESCEDDGDMDFKERGINKSKWKFSES